MVLYEGMGELPHFNPDDDREGEPVHPAVADLHAQIAAADALLLCTPEYAGTLPGAFKNLLEWTVGDAGTYGKPVAWINASGGAVPTGAADAHESLHKVLGYVGADIVEDACARIPITRESSVRTARSPTQRSAHRSRGRWRRSFATPAPATQTNLDSRILQRDGLRAALVDHGRPKEQWLLN